MPLPRVKVALHAAGDVPDVSVDGVPIPGVVGFVIRNTPGAVPVVGLDLLAGSVELDLPATVTAVTSARSASAFVDAIDPAQLEADMVDRLGGLEGDATTGEAARAVLALYAADFDA